METREKENSNAKIDFIGIGAGGKSPLSFSPFLFLTPSLCVLFSYLLALVSYPRAGYGFTKSFFLIGPAPYQTGHHILSMLLTSRL